MNRYLRLSGAFSLLCLFPSLGIAQGANADDLNAIMKRLEALEQQVTELRRQAGVQTAVETVARELRQRRPRFQKIRSTQPANTGASLADQKALALGADNSKLDQLPAAVPTMVPDRLALRIDGIEIKRQEIDDCIRFARSVVQGSDESVLKHVMERVLVPRCTAQAAGGDAGIEDVLTRANALRSQIVDGGEEFASVATASSEDQASAASGGVLAPMERSAQPMMVAKAAFETAAGNVSPVVLSEQGAHFLYVEKKGKADPKDPASPLVVTARQVLVKWPAGSTEKPAPRIELFDSTLRAALPSGATIIDHSTEMDDMRASELAPAKHTHVDADGDNVATPPAPKKGG